MTGYIECLSCSHGDNEEPDAPLTFDFGPAPAPAGLSDVLASDGGTWKAHATTFTCDPGPRTSFKEVHNRKVVRWFHALVKQQLMPIHAKHPFLALRVGNARLA